MLTLEKILNVFRYAILDDYFEFFCSFSSQSQIQSMELCLIFFSNYVLISFVKQVFSFPSVFEFSKLSGRLLGLFT